MLDLAERSPWRRGAVPRTGLNTSEKRRASPRGKVPPARRRPSPGAPTCPCWPLCLIASHHTPRAPSPLTTPHHADTSYSDSRSPDRRGCAVHEVALDLHTGDCRVHGRLPCGTMVDFLTSDPYGELRGSGVGRAGEVAPLLPLASFGGGRASHPDPPPLTQQWAAVLTMPTRGVSRQGQNAATCWRRQWVGGSSTGGAAKRRWWRSLGEGSRSPKRIRGASLMMGSRSHRAQKMRSITVRRACM